MVRTRIGCLGVGAQLIAGMLLTLGYQQVHARGDGSSCRIYSNQYAQFIHGSVVTASTPVENSATTKFSVDSTRGTSARNSASTTTPTILNFPLLDSTYVNDYIKNVMEKLKEFFKSIWQSFPISSSDAQIGKRRKRALDGPDCSGTDCTLVLDLTGTFGYEMCPPSARRYYSKEFTFNATNVANVSFKKENGQPVTLDKTQNGADVFYKRSGELDAKQFSIKFTVQDPRNVAVAYQYSYCYYENC